jgi:hypothetical protein
MKRPVGPRGGECEQTAGDEEHAKSDEAAGGGRRAVL